MKTVKMEENADKRTAATRITTRRAREMKIWLLRKLQEKKIHCVSTPGPQLQLGRPPTAGRKMGCFS